MSTFRAHGLAGCTALEAARALRPDDGQGRRWPWVFASLSILPDLDGARARSGREFLESTPSMSLVRAMLLAISSSAIVLGGIDA